MGLAADGEGGAGLGAVLADGAEGEVVGRGEACVAAVARAGELGGAAGDGAGAACGAEDGAGGQGELGLEGADGGDLRGRRGGCGGVCGGMVEEKKGEKEEEGEGEGEREGGGHRCWGMGFLVMVMVMDGGRDRELSYRGGLIGGMRGLCRTGGRAARDGRVRVATEV